MHMSKKRRRDRLRNFSWTARGEASLREEPTPSYAVPFYLDFMVSKRKMLRWVFKPVSSLLPRFHDLKKKDAQVGIQTSQSFKKDHSLSAVL